MRIVFFGTSQYCLPVLESLKNNFELVQVITREDKPVGRKQVLTPSATKIWAIKNGVHLQETTSLEGKFDLGIVADYGRIISEKEFNLPKLGTFNIHFSKLPDLRGASPVQQTILRGDKTAWVTIFKIEETLDTGPILDQREFPIFPNETAGDVYTRLFQEVANYLPTLDFAKKLVPQTGTPTFCKLLKRDDGFIKEVSELTFNKFRAMNPWPGVWTIKDGKRMKILKCHLENEILVVDEIQFEGKSPQSYH